MEAAISSSLSHPNIVQTYTYTIRPMRDNSSQGALTSSDANVVEATYETTGREPNSAGSGGSSNVHSYEVRRRGGDVLRWVVCIRAAGPIAMPVSEAARACVLRSGMHAGCGSGRLCCARWRCMRCCFAARRCALCLSSATRAV